MRSPKKLEDRATQYQGEIERFLCEFGFCHRVTHQNFTPVLPNVMLRVLPLKPCLVSC